MRGNEPIYGVPLSINTRQVTPGGPGDASQGGGLSPTAARALLTYLRGCMTDTNVSGAYATLEAELLGTGGGSGDSGDTGGNTPDIPDDPVVVDDITVTAGVMTIVSVGSGITVSDGVMTIA